MGRWHLDSLGHEDYANRMSVKFVYWQSDSWWIGYLEEYPDYWTQGESFDDLKEHLKDLYEDLSGGSIPNVRRVAELEVG